MTVSRTTSMTKIRAILKEEQLKREEQQIPEAIKLREQEIAEAKRLKEEQARQEAEAKRLKEEAEQEQKQKLKTAQNALGIFDEFIKQISDKKIKEENISNELEYYIEHARIDGVFKNYERLLLDKLVDLLTDVKKMKGINEKTLKYIQKKIAETILKDINQHHGKDFDELNTPYGLNKLLRTTSLEQLNLSKLDIAEIIINHLKPHLNKDGKVAKECAKLLSASSIHYQKVGAARGILNLKRSKSVPALPKINQEPPQPQKGTSIFKSPSGDNIHTDDPATPRSSFGN